MVALKLFIRSWTSHGGIHQRPRESSLLRLHMHVTCKTSNFHLPNPRRSSKGNSSVPDGDVRTEVLTFAFPRTNKLPCWAIFFHERFCYGRGTDAGITQPLGDKYAHGVYAIWMDGKSLVRHCSIIKSRTRTDVLMFPWHDRQTRSGLTHQTDGPVLCSPEG